MESCTWYNTEHIDMYITLGNDYPLTMSLPPSPPPPPPSLSLSLSLSLTLFLSLSGDLELLQSTWII